MTSLTRQWQLQAELQQRVTKGEELLEQARKTGKATIGEARHLERNWRGVSYVTGQLRLTRITQQDTHFLTALRWRTTLIADGWSNVANYLRKQELNGR